MRIRSDPRRQRRKKSETKWRGFVVISDRADLLTKAIAARERVPEEQIVLGEILGQLGFLLALTGPVGGEFIYSAPGYTALVDAVAPGGGQAVAVPLNDRLENDLPAISARVNSRTRAIYLVNPHNPSGTVSDRETFLRVVSSSQVDSMQVDLDMHKYRVHHNSKIDTARFEEGKRRSDRSVLQVANLFHETSTQYVDTLPRWKHPRRRRKRGALKGMDFSIIRDGLRPSDKAPSTQMAGSSKLKQLYPSAISYSRSSDARSLRRERAGSQRQCKARPYVDQRFSERVGRRP
jgi:aminotransferase class I and II